MTSQSVLLAAGSNSGGQLGLGHDNDAHVLEDCCCTVGSFPPQGWAVDQLSAGSNHAVALLRSNGSRDADAAPSSDLQLWACGSGNQGQLGKRVPNRETTFRRLDLVKDLGLLALLPGGTEVEIHHWRPVRVACGWNSTFVVLQHDDRDEDDMLLVLGKDNDFGQLGLGETKSIEVGLGLLRLRQGNDDEGTLRIGSLACGLRHTVVQCCIKNSNGEKRTQVLGWGAARHGQLDSKFATKYPASYWRAHLVEEWEGSTSTQHSIILAAGKEHSVYRRGDNSIRIVGSNRQGQQLVGDALALNAVLSAACTWNATLVLSQDSIFGSGNNDKGQLGASTKDDGVAKANIDSLLKWGEEKKRSLKSLVCGSEHAMVLVSELGHDGGQVWGWGWNEHGNLAQGNEEDQHKPVCIWPPRYSNTSYHSHQATDVWAGCGTTFIQIRKEHP